MHYGATAFTRNGQPTIRPKQSGVSDNSLGQRQGFSANDLEHVRALYCSNGENFSLFSSSLSVCLSVCPSFSLSLSLSLSLSFSFLKRCNMLTLCFTSIAPTSWSAWSSWSSCTQTCNGGTRTRLRTCNGGGSCEGANIDTQVCNPEDCPSEFFLCAVSGYEKLILNEDPCVCTIFKYKTLDSQNNSDLYKCSKILYRKFDLAVEGSKILSLSSCSLLNFSCGYMGLMDRLEWMFS